MKNPLFAFVLAMSGLTVSAHTHNEGVCTDSLKNGMEPNVVSQLDGVEVVAQKPIVRLEADKMTYNVQQDADAQSMSVLDILRKVPMVTVDAQDNIMVKGSTSFKVLVDGKSNVQMQSSSKEVLKSMPASMVEKIEVITSPGAKYDAEGVSGVLNFVIHHDVGNNGNDKVKGYTGGLNGTFSNRAQMGYGYLSGQSRKFTYNIDLYMGKGNVYGYDVDTERLQYGETGSVVSTKQKSDLANPYAGAILSLNYDLDSLNVINASAGISYLDYSLCGTKNNVSITGRTYFGGLVYSSLSESIERASGFNASADWQHFFNSDHSHSFTLSYQFSGTPKREQYDNYNDDESGRQAFGYGMNSLNKTNMSEHTFQADYTLPLSEGHKLSAGAKYILRCNRAEGGYCDLDSVGLIVDPPTDLEYKSHQQILSSYIEHNGIYGKWGTREGIRYEHTWENIDYPAENERNFKKNYDNLIPSVNVSYRFSNSTNLALSYSMRIKRPGISYMNPCHSPSDVTSVTYGNPDLKVEKANYIDLVFNHYKSKFMMNATLSQCLCNNQIASYAFTDVSGKLYTTYTNSVKNRWTNLNTWMRVVAGKKTSIMLNGYMGYGDIRSEQLDAHNSGWQASAMLMLEQELPWKLKLDLGLQASTRTYNLQGYDGGMSMFYLVFTRSFFKERLTVSYFAMTPFSDMLKVTEYKHSSQFEDYTTIRLNLRTFQLSVCWKFGNTAKQFSRHQSKISSEFGESKSQIQQVNNIGAGAK